MLVQQYQQYIAICARNYIMLVNLPYRTCMYASVAVVVHSHIYRYCIMLSVLTVPYLHACSCSSSNTVDASHHTVDSIASCMYIQTLPCIVPYDPVYISQYHVCIHRPVCMLEGFPMIYHTLACMIRYVCIAIIQQNSNYIVQTTYLNTMR